ncbi:hypothetical protein NEDG_00429 [Nematocida displodere]|uniref:Uncharacterized protein n=1 Tax=Nematocida displodere TaxID=1805483 RepID=A0A177EJ01_9MICR|nr:hypothetical protein NEDG_00429 [Nematocida displodere]
MEWIETVSSLMKSGEHEKALASVEEAEKKEGVSMETEVFRAIIQLHLHQPSSILQVIEKYPTKYLPSMRYANYLISQKQVEESIPYAEQVLRLSPEKTDREDMLRLLVTASIATMDGERLVGAFRYALDLIHAPFLYNVTLLWNVTKTIAKVAALGPVPGLDQELHSQILGVKQSLDATYGVREPETETSTYKDARVETGPGFQRFLGLNKLEIRIEAETETGVKYGFTPEDEGLLVQGKYLEFFEAFLENAPEPAQSNKNASPITAAIELMIRKEDIFLLYQIGEAMSASRLYSCSRFMFAAVVDAFAAIDRTKYSFLQVCTVQGSTEFANLATFAYSQCTLAQKAVKNLHIAQSNTKAGNGVSDPEMERVLVENFSFLKALAVD